MVYLPSALGLDELPAMVELPTVPVRVSPGIWGSARAVEAQRAIPRDERCMVEVFTAGGESIDVLKYLPSLGG